MQNKKLHTDSIIFVLCLLSLFCIGARIIFTVYQISGENKKPVSEDSAYHISESDLNEKGIYYLYGSWEYYPGHHICAEGIKDDLPESSAVEVPLNWNMFDKRFWNASGGASYRMTVDIPGEDTYILYLHGMPSRFNIYIDRMLSPMIASNDYFFNRGVEISAGKHEIIIEVTSDWLTGFYFYPWLYTHESFEKQSQFSISVWEISLGAFFIAALYGAIFFRKSLESLFFKRQMVNTLLFFVFYQLSFLEYSLDTVILSKVFPISKMHIITLVSGIILGVHTIQMYQEQLSNLNIRKALKIASNILFAVIFMKTFVSAYINLQFMVDLLIMFMVGIILISVIGENAEKKYGVKELAVSVLLIGTAIVIGGSANTKNFFGEIYYILPLTFILTLLCYGSFIAAEFAHIEDEARKKRVLEQQLIDAKMAYLTSQIQPHFQYNTLAMIQELCYSNPMKAADAIVKFSSVLRRRVDFNKYSQLGPFAEELSCIEDYIQLQEIRFGDSLKFVERVEYTDFLVPPLSIQTLIENAIYHGIRKKKETGIIVLEVFRENDVIIIKIADTGVGFDPEILDNTNGNGLRNSKARIETLTGGSLQVISAFNEGTTVIIKIPKGRRL